MRRPGEDGKPIDHVSRRGLPWRDASLTECGLPLANHPALTRQAFEAKVQEQGQTRAAMTTCMTCWQTSSDWSRRAQGRTAGLFDALERELTWGRWHQDSPLHGDLEAIALLIQRHRAEFDEILEDRAAVVPIATAKKPAPARERRKW